MLKFTEILNEAKPTNLSMAQLKKKSMKQLEKIAKEYGLHNVYKTKDSFIEAIFIAMNDDGSYDDE